MKTKPVTPYERLLRRYNHAITRAVYPTRRLMWTYTKASIENGTTYTLDSLAERVKAADQLGYDVRLVWTDAGLAAQYIERFVEPAE